ncbi:Iron-containing alcohol dehydrogenase [Ensifer sp. YR511]|nr:Iron-containing alcohol dehydrogenase [Ensifer sp. YR511]
MDFFNTSFAVFGAPGRYLQGRGVARLAGPCAGTLGGHAVLVCDDIVAALVEPVIAESCREADVQLQRVEFSGEINAQTGPMLSRRLQFPHGRPTVIAAGGGRSIDAGKALREELGGGLITLPTVASNDSPTSKNYVLYDSQHRLAEVRHMPRNADFVLVDTELLARAPRSFFLAGLGDAIAKNSRPTGALPPAARRCSVPAPPGPQM